MVNYHSIDGLPGYFECPNGLGTISTLFCADCHRKAKTRPYITEHRRTACRFCAIGALHAGERDSETGSRLYGSLLCARCERVTDRLVGGTVCVSCYNRLRENKAGLNARGTPLKLVRHYYPVTLMIVKNHSVQLRIMDNVLALSEALFSVLLTERDSVAFGETENSLFFSQNAQ